jgi:hypothetical protein
LLLNVSHGSNSIEICAKDIAVVGLDAIAQHQTELRNAIVHSARKLGIFPFDASVVPRLLDAEKTPKSIASKLWFRLGSEMHSNTFKSSTISLASRRRRRRMTKKSARHTAKPATTRASQM